MNHPHFQIQMAKNYMKEAQEQAGVGPRLWLIRKNSAAKVTETLS